MPLLLQNAAAIERRLVATESTLAPFIRHVLQLPRAETGFCPEPWSSVLFGLAANHACAGGLIKLPALVKPVLASLVAGNLLTESQKLTLFR